MKTIIIVSVVAIVGAALLLAGCKPPRSPEQGVERFFEEISDKLDLSEAQTTQLLSIKDELFEKGREMHKDRERMHDYCITIPVHLSPSIPCIYKEI